MDHVEECPSYYVDCLGTICDCDYEHICMCRELLACEQRVLNEYRKAHDGISERYFQQIWNDALDAAREAVKGINWFSDEGKMLSAVVATANSISAIDALRKGNQP